MTGAEMKKTSHFCPTNEGGGHGVTCGTLWCTSNIAAGGRQLERGVPVALPHQRGVLSLTTALPLTPISNSRPLLAAPTPTRYRARFSASHTLRLAPAAVPASAVRATITTAPRLMNTAAALVQLDVAAAQSHGEGADAAEVANRYARSALPLHASVPAGQPAASYPHPRELSDVCVSTCPPSGPRLFTMLSSSLT